ncbi:formylmethanofuran dehydrogenase subunit C [soil metagenome]
MLTLRFTSDTLIPVEAECLCADQLQPLSKTEIERLPVQHGNAQVPLAEFFEITGDATDGQIRIEGDCRRVKRIGVQMKAGVIEIDGSAGMHLGADMTGGLIRVHGDVGDWAGAEMLGGRIDVLGNAGDYLGAGYRGARRGMRGGSILVHGNAGNEVGSVMRRGLIAIGGQAGDFVGVSMIAGTILVFGDVGIRTGAGMKRGTIGAFGNRPKLLPTFRESCVYRPPFLPLYVQKLHEWGLNSAAKLALDSWARFCGDLVTLGKGEIFCRPQ